MSLMLYCFFTTKQALHRFDAVLTLRNEVEINVRGKITKNEMNFLLLLCSLRILSHFLDN